FFSSGAVAIMRVVAKLGSQIVGGDGAAQRLDNIIMLPTQSLGASVNSMAGQNISIGQWRRVSRITKYGMLYNLMIMSIIGDIIFIFAKYLTMMIVQDEEEVNFATRYFQILHHYVCFVVINICVNVSE